MTPLLVIHDLGAPGGGPWRAAFGPSWPGRVDSPDLPGHGDAPAPAGGNYEQGDAVFAVADRLPGPDDVQPVVLGVGHNGHAVQVLALAGRASALVLVDGLGGPWLDVPERNEAVRSVRRDILITPSALDPHVPGSTDPRATLVLGSSDRDHAVRMLESVPVPTLVVETPSSPTTDADELAASIPRGALVRVRSSEPAAVAERVLAWWSDVER